MKRDISLRTPFVVASIAATALFAASMAFGGLVLLPLAQSNLEVTGLWDAICSAAGVTHAKPSSTIVPASLATSQVVLTAMARPAAASIGRGATIAHQCAICHGPMQASGVPNLAGQPALVIDKELHDFRSGARVNGVMGPFAAALTEEGIADVAAYYADLPRTPGVEATGPALAPRIVVNGAPMRNIAPCGSCHGALASKAGAPWLEGQPVTYLLAQLTAFKAGERHNDISEQMRNVARLMTPDEMASASRYFSDSRAN